MWDGGSSLCSPACLRKIKVCVAARVELGGQEGGEGVRAGVGGEGEDMLGGFRAD